MSRESRHAGAGSASGKGEADGGAAELGLELRGVSISLDGRRLVHNLDLRVAPGSVTTLMGPSGCGKSTLLSWLCGMLEPAFRARGRVMVDGRDVTGLPAEHRGIGILFQDDLLFPHMSVGENLLFALPRQAGLSRRERRERAEAALAEAGLAGFFERDPATLSGGQRARAALMRTLLAGPSALLLDEPFSKLDAGTREPFRAFVLGHARRLSLPMLMVTHDPGDAEAAGGPILLMAQASREAEREQVTPDATSTGPCPAPTPG